MRYQSELKRRPKDIPHGPCHGQASVCNVFGEDLPGLNLWHVLVEPGASMEAHQHPCEEVYYVVAGIGTIVVDDQQLKVRSGDAAFIPSNAVHCFMNDGNVACEILAVSHLEIPAPHKR